MNKIKDGLIYYTDSSTAYKLNGTRVANGSYKSLATEFSLDLLGETEYGNRIKEFREKFENIKRQTETPMEIHNEKLRPYQNIDVTAGI